jgi:acetyl-CoA acetyltransferase
MAQRHMIEFGTTEEELGHIPLVCRARANANPAAQMHERPMTMDDYLAARMISRPLRLFDFSLETDGACAVIVTSTERARDLRRPPVLIRAVAQGSGSEPQMSGRRSGGRSVPSARPSGTVRPSVPVAGAAEARVAVRGAAMYVPRSWRC